MLQLKQSVWHPCFIDIIEFKVTGIHTYENVVMYTLKSVKNVGIYYNLTVTITENSHNQLWFHDIPEEVKDSYNSGLQDFVEGQYFDTLEQARLKYYKKQLTLARTNYDNKERLFKEAKARVDQVQLLVEELTQLLKETPND